MKRVHLFEEAPDEEEQQALVAALVLNNAVVTLTHVPPLLLAFRHHPWRLLRLMSANKKLREAVEYMERTMMPLLWYDAALHAFPDICIMLHVCASLYKTFYDDVTTGNSTSDTLFMAYVEVGRGWNIPELIRISTSEGSGLMKRRSFAQNKLHDSFTRPALLDACLAERKVAKRTEQCFKMLRPFGIPPAQYCFCSQVALQRLTIDFLVLLPPRGTSMFRHTLMTHTFMQYIIAEYTAISLDWAESRLPDTLPRITLQSLLKFTDPESLEPRDMLDGHPLGRVFNGAVYGLVDLARSILRQLRANVQDGKLQKQRELLTLYDTVIKTALRYDTTDALVLAQFFSVESDELAWEPYPLKEGEHSVDALREVDMEHYGVYDPLYWDVLVRHEVPPVSPRRKDAGQTIDWKAVVKGQIDLVRHTYGDQSPEYARMERFDPSVLTLGCMAAHCNERTPSRLSIEPDAPFRVYCSEQCRKSQRALESSVK